MRLLCLVLILFNFQLSISQEDNINQLLAQAENTIYANPQEAIRIVEYINTKTDNPAQRLHASYLLTTSYYIQGTLDKALEVGLKALHDNTQELSINNVKLYALLIKILKELELNKLATRYTTAAIKASNSLSDSAIQEWLQGKILQYNTVSDSAEATQKTFQRLYKSKAYLTKFTGPFQTSQIGNINLDIAALQLREFQLDSVSYYLEEAYTESKKYNPENYLEMKSLQLFGNYLFLQKQHTAAIDSLQVALRIAEKFTHLQEQISISEAIADNYLALNDLENFKNQNAKTQLLNSAQTDVENDAVNIAFNFSSNNEA
ncbi:hypothetical protein [Aequorivita flava]|uniref:hypothetical protein n=1 Tax=Aequorivita flava TaxID=3114371 RepID=UPI00316AD1D5